MAKLKDLNIKSISLVSKKARPVHQDSKILMIKAKEEKRVDFYEFMKTQYEKFMGSPLPDAPVNTQKAETQKEEKAPEFVSKSEFNDCIKGLGDKIDKLADIVSKSTTVEKAEKETMGTFIQQFAEAYKNDQETLKASINESIEKAKRAVSPILEQPSIEDMIKSVLNPVNMMGSNKTNSSFVADIVEKGVKAGTYTRIPQQKLQNSAFEAFKDIVNAASGIQQGGNQ